MQVAASFPIAVLLLTVCHAVSGAKKCEEKTGTCAQRTSLLRYHFNRTIMRCASFYTCPGEGDKFYPRMMECVKDCRPKQKPPKCYAQRLTECRGDTSGGAAWTYNLDKRQCEQVSNGCPLKSANRFTTKDGCLAECFGFGKKGLIKRKGRKSGRGRKSGK
uniref:Dual kunitz salivary protein n=1 Tax=Ornithodoros coriaceus TaxID=92741 RepID=B2D285_ORNCO|nr:dual kunitz salivary protein [Ornithodoros coriaceus]